MTLRMEVSNQGWWKGPLILWSNHFSSGLPTSIFLTTVILDFCYIQLNLILCIWEGERYRGFQKNVIWSVLREKGKERPFMKLYHERARHIQTIWSIERLEYRLWRENMAVILSSGPHFWIMSTQLLWRTSEARLGMAIGHFMIKELSELFCSKYSLQL